MTRFCSAIVILIVFFIVFFLLQFKYLSVIVGISSVFVAKEYATLLRLNRYKKWTWITCFTLGTGVLPVYLFNTLTIEHIRHLSSIIFFALFFATIIWLHSLTVMSRVSNHDPLSDNKKVKDRVLFLDIYLVFFSYFTYFIFVISVFMLILYDVKGNIFYVTNSVIDVFLYPCLLVWASDSGAYFVGKKFGKTKLSKWSPKKTVEGMIGGIIFALVVVVAGMYYFPVFDNLLFIDRIYLIILSIITVIAGVYGDLFESFLKRRACVKDSSNLIPGHGGILDRIDALIPAITIFALGYYYFI